jgi:drug/metabolite transporter (DMT)-like permease
VALVVDGIGVLLMVIVGLAIREPFPGPTTLGLAILAGILSVAGIVGLYQGLAVGRMGVVAPVTGLLAASIPVAVGFVGAGLPAPEVVIGIALALVAVILVSRSHDPEGRPSGIEYGIVGGVGLGLFNVAVGAFPEDRVAWPLVAIKLAALITIALLVLGRRRPWRVPRPVLPVVVAVGLVDLVGNGLYVLATQAGRLDVAAALSSLYPVTTVILAVAILHERVTRSHLVGIVMAAVAIVLIAGGSVSPAA